MNEFSLPNAGEQTKEEKHSFILDMRRFFPRPSAVAVVEAAAALLIFGYVHIINPTGRPDRSSARRGNEEKTAAMMIGSSKWKAVSAAIEKQQTVAGVRGSLGPGNGSTQSNDHRSTHLKGEEMRKNEFTDDGIGQVFFLLSVSRCLCLCLCLCRSHLFPIPSSIHLSATAPPDLTRPLRRPSN